jgi:hypothetical protein
MKKAEKNDQDFYELQRHSDSVFREQMQQLKALVKERETCHLYIERLLAENEALSAINSKDETVAALTYAMEQPNDYEVVHCASNEINRSTSVLFV